MVFPNWVWGRVEFLGGLVFMAIWVEKKKNKNGGLGPEHEVDANPDPTVDDEGRAERWGGMDAEAEGGVQGFDRLHPDEQVQR